MSNALFVGIDNGKHGAMSIIDNDRNIISLTKYDEKDVMNFYRVLKALKNNHALYAFIEKPIVVYGLAHQTAPFETIGRHKMMLDILEIPFYVGDPAATSPNNWKKILSIFDQAKSAASSNTKDISACNKEMKKLIIEAELLNSGKEDLEKGKIAYMKENLAEIATKYRILKKQVAALKRDKKSDVKQVSLDACFEMFPEAKNLLVKSSKAIKNKYDDDIAEALLLAECGRVLYNNGKY